MKFSGRQELNVTERSDGDFLSASGGADHSVATLLAQTVFPWAHLLVRHRPANLSPLIAFQSIKNFVA